MARAAASLFVTLVLKSNGEDLITRRRREYNGQALNESLVAYNSNAEGNGEIVAYHCTLEGDVDSILADTFRIPTATYAQDHGLKFGAAAYLGPNITYCISEAANTFAERYVEAQHPDQPDYEPSEKEYREAKELVLTKLGLPGSGTAWAMGCIEATVDLKRVLNVLWSPETKWPLTGKTNGKDCKLPGRNETKYINNKDCSKYNANHTDHWFGEYTSRITPQYMDYYGYDTALLYFPKRSDFKRHRNSSSAERSRQITTGEEPSTKKRYNSDHDSKRGGGTSSVRRRRRNSLSTSTISSNVSSSDEEWKEGNGPREVVVFDWNTRVKMCAGGPRKVSNDFIMQHWPTATETTTTQTKTSETSTTTDTTTMPPPPSPTLAPKPSDEECRACNTMCAQCQACADSQEGECYKCWHCWDYDDNKLEDDDNEMDKDCDVMHKDHDWDDDEVRCLTDELTKLGMDCRACWAELGEVMVV